MEMSVSWLLLNYDGLELAHEPLQLRLRNGDDSTVAGEVGFLASVFVNELGVNFSADDEDFEGHSEFAAEGVGILFGLGFGIASDGEGVGEIGGLPGEDGDFKLYGLDGLLQAARGIGGLVPLAEGAVGVPAVLGELGDEGLLPLGKLRWLGCEGGGQNVALDEEGVDGASEVAGDEEFELGVGEEAVLRARVLEAVDGLLGLRDGIVRPGAIRGANEADDGIALLQVLGQHTLHIMRGRVEACLDDRLNAPQAKNLGDSLRETFESGGGAGDEDAGLAGHAESGKVGLIRIDTHGRTRKGLGSFKLSLRGVIK